MCSAHARRRPADAAYRVRGVRARLALAGTHAGCDTGRFISPPIVRGQIERSAVPGIGQALGAAVRHDRETGQLRSASYLDHALSHARPMTPGHGSHLPKSAVSA